MDDWSVGALPLHGRANMPAEMGPAYGESGATVLNASELKWICAVLLASHDSNAMTGQMMHLVSRVSVEQRSESGSGSGFGLTGARTMGSGLVERRRHSTSIKMI